MTRYNVIALSVLLLVAGCTSQERLASQMVSGADDHHFTYVRKAPPTMYAMPNLVKQAVLSNEQRKVLQKALTEANQRRDSSIKIVVPQYAKNQNDLNRLEEMVMTYLRYSGVPSERISVAKIPLKKKEKAYIRLDVYGVVGAVQRECGIWPDDILNDKDMRTYSNFGCSMNNNIAVQMDNTNDQYRMRNITPPDAGRINRILKKYQQGELSLKSDNKE
ncbi:CpaD family pilus assembly lipoprotein [Brucella gallinifaecis]|uniref:Pilus assembly protein CpaD n=1 Tax=Brucella gallinifaecis TaxID=215590 RepID=A0A502BQM5_9HYPH|nr:CpaD family pilus assembly lipoprotein [Brucella gallinifaecis]TPF75448.1 hypothetical protein FHY56_09310 [Brucella gallinifaecis]